jgi:hypothetical protein
MLLCKKELAHPTTARLPVLASDSAAQCKKKDHPWTRRVGKLRLSLLPMLQEEGYIQVQENKTGRKVIKDFAAALVGYGLVLVNGQLRPHGWRPNFDMTRRIKK